MFRDKFSGSNDSKDSMPTDLRPLKYYINNREKMLQKAFSSIQGTQLDKLIPGSLKHLPLEELKADCLVQLLGMSKKRILAILEGRTLLSSSSETDTGDSDGSGKEATETSIKKSKTNERKSPAIKTNKPRDCVVTKPQIKNEEKKTTKGDSDIKKKTSDDGKKKKRKNSPSPHKRQEGKDISDEETNKTTLLEILELEMRAKAIRALLRHEDEKRVSECDNEEEMNGATEVKVEPQQKNSTTEISKKRSSPRRERADSTAAVADWMMTSSDVKRVMKTTRMIANVRKRMKTIHGNEKRIAGELETKKTSVKDRVDIEGSVKEYKMLASRK